MSTLQKALCLSALATLAFAQPPDVQRGPIAFSGVGNDSAIFVGAGGPNGAIGWRLTYFVDGTNFTAAQVAIQGADAANAAGCATASFTTIATANADVVESVNPSVSAAQGNVAAKSYYPCIRMRVTAVTGSGGTVVVSIAGWKNVFVWPVTATFVPSGTQNVNLIQVAGTAVATGGVAGSQGVGGVAAAGATTNLGNPNQVGGIGPDGALRALLVDSLGTQYIFNGCGSQIEVALSGTAYTQIIAGSGSNVIRICKLFVTSSSGGAPVVNTFTVGFGTCAGTPTEALNAGAVTGLDMDFGGSLRGAAGAALCVKECTANSDKVTVTYAQTVF